MKKVLILIVLMLAAPAQALELTIYTEEFPPFNYTSQGAITGVSTKVVQEVMAATGYNITIKSLPWADAYERAQNEPNTLIYSISRRKNREPLFKWIGILTPTTYSVKALRSRNDIQVERFSDLRRYKIGTTIDDASELWLINNGLNKEEFIRTTGTNSQIKNFKNLLNRQIDLWPSPDAVAFYIARQQGQSDPAAIMKSVYPMEELSGGYYIAASLNTPDSVVTTVRKALEQYKRSDDYYKMLSRWGVNAMGLKTTEPVGKLIYAFRHLTRLTKVGYLANDKLAAHKEGGLYRKEMREDFLEAYVTTFKQWQDKFVELQNEVDAIILGDVSGIQGWSDGAAQVFAMNATRVPTGYVLDGMSNYTMIGYEEDDLVVNKTIAAAAKIKIPNGILNKAARVIE